MVAEQLRKLASKLRKEGHGSYVDWALTSYQSELDAGVRESLAAQKWFSNLEQHSRKKKG